MLRPYLDRVSISELAKLSGVPARTLRSYRRGDRRPTPKKLHRIMEALAQMLDEAEG
jgi:transcriptional regulator with XRE-family HTH domain